MITLEDRIKDFSNRYFKALSEASNTDALENIRVQFLGRNGQLITLMDALKSLSLEEKRQQGPLLNSLKEKALQALEERKQELIAQVEKSQAAQLALFDVTAYKPGVRQGTLHPFTHIVQRIEDIFVSMGFQKAEGPEIDTDFYNFEALNIPQDHPARDMHDTFWLTLPHQLLRTHTSTVEIHAMKSSRPPLAIFAPGRVYRHEATDATHDYVFMQCEGLLVDKNVSMANLLATLRSFMQALFEKKELDIRVRPSYFPFVEPGVEVDITCPFCTAGCSICKKSRWIELGGAGLTHPHVLKSCNIDPTIYSGFAFGFGIERLAMLLYGINDIRLFRSNKLEFLSQSKA